MPTRLSWARFCIGVFAGLISCCLWASRPAGAVLPPCSAVSSANAILYYTDRARSADAQLFNGERALDERRRAVPSSGVIAPPVGSSGLRPCTTSQRFFDAIAKRFAPAGKQALIYVPGYYTTFVQAANDAVVLAKHLKFRGPVMLYSWPSKVTSRLAYVNDESNADWSAVAFRNLLGSIERRFPGTKISFATHSLGSRFAADGMGVLRHVGCSQACFGRALLFAPDIDGDTLREELAELGLCAGPPASTPVRAAPVTLYVSNRDVALRQSQRLHGHQRAGQAGSEMILCSGVDTIDVGYRRFGDAAGHTYQTDPRVLADAAAAFSGISPADVRRRLRRVDRAGATYYELR